MNKIKKEMLALVGACTQEYGDNFLVPSELNNEFTKILTKTFNIYNDENKLEKFDLIIEETPSDFIKIYEKLNETGIYITSADFNNKDLFANLSKLFYIVMPYYYINEDGKREELVFASKKIHPTADLIRHRSDFVENSFYYTTDIHLASFVLPKYIFESLKDVIKL